jgi:hypothetical protein
VSHSLVPTRSPGWIPNDARRACKCSHGRGRAVLACLVVVMALLACTGGAAATVQGRFPATGAGVASASSAPQKVYFDLGLLGGLGGFAIEPKVVLYSADGSHALENRRWSGWGSASAHGSGLDSVNNCTPQCADGHWQSRPVMITLSGFGKVDGHLVYWCTAATGSSPAGGSTGSCSAGAAASLARSPCRGRRGRRARARR